VQNMPMDMLCAPPNHSPGVVRALQYSPQHKLQDIPQYKLQDIPQYNPLDLPGTGVVRGPLGGPMLIYIASAYGVLLLDFVNMCRYWTSYTVVGVSHATQLAKAETFANFIDTLVGWVLDICDGQPIYLTGYSFGAIQVPTLNDFQPDTFDPGHKIFASRTCPDKRFSHLSEAKWCWERQGRINRGQQLAIESD
jgi:hypothetical protein